MFSIAIIVLPFCAFAQAHISAPRSLATTGTPINHNGDVTKCLGVFNADLTDRTYIQLQDCDGSKAQSWTINRGNTKVQLTGTKFCLDASDSPGTGVAMKIRDCTDNSPAQAWTYTDANHIQLAGQQQCVDLSKGDSTNGNLVQSWACNIVTTNQVWTIPSTTHSGVAVHPIANDKKCLDVKSGNITTGTPVVIFDCNGSDTQKWVISRGNTKIQVAGTNFCVDPSASPANGVAMALRECNSDLTIPSWTYTTDNKVVSVAGNWCLDLRGGIITNNNPVQTWRCAANPNQLWVTNLK